jgi:hypothetical protein
MFADGSNGSVEFLGDHIVIRRKGFANVLTQGVQGDKTIPIANITAVQFRSAGSWMSGLIQFTLLGGREFRGGMMEATKDENAVMFVLEQEPAFAELRDVVQAAILQGGRLAPQRGGSGPADELMKLSELLDKGHLSQEEFDTAKRGVLGAVKPSPPPKKEPTFRQPPLPPPKEHKSKAGCLVVLGIIGVLILIGSFAGDTPKWGEPGYQPKISDKCRSVWASVNVDAPRYMAVVCTPEEQHEIAGYRPKN